MSYNPDDKFNASPVNGVSPEEDELIDYMLEVIELKERVRYLEAIEHTARKYAGRGNRGAKLDLITALDMFEQLERSKWADANTG